MMTLASVTFTSPSLNCGRSQDVCKQKFFHRLVGWFENL